MVLLAAYKVFLYKYTGTKDLIIGTPVAGRDMLEVEDNIGYFINTIALRSEIDTESTFSQYLNSIRRISIDAFAHGDYPFDLVVKDINPKRNLSRTPIFQSMFNLMNKSDKPFRIQNAEISEAGIVNDLAPYDLTMIVWNEKDELSFYVEYYSEIFNEDTIKIMMKNYRSVLAEVIKNSQVKIDEIELEFKHENQQFIADGYYETGKKEVACAINEEIGKTGEMIHLMWRERLGDREIGYNVNFFDAGGHSMMMMEIINKINREFDINLQVIDFFKNPTINSLARLVNNNESGEKKADVKQKSANKRREALSRLVKRRKK